MTAVFLNEWALVQFSVGPYKIVACANKIVARAIFIKS